MSNFIKGWYAVYTKPKHEKKIASLLADSGITHFFPVVRTLRKWHDRNKVITAPLFPSYIFVYLTTKTDYYRSLAFEGVWHFVRSGNEFSRIPDKVISDLQIAISSGNEIEVTVEHFTPGCQLTISKGPLTGLSCEVVDHKGKKGFLVRVTLLKRNILVYMPSESLTALPA